MSDNAEYKEAFALFDKRGTGAVPRETLGELLRALGQNPTQAEVAEIISSAPRDVDYKTFLSILNRPDGFKPAGTPEEFIRGFQVFDKDGNGFIGAGELRYVLTQLGEKMTDEEVDELLKGVQIGADGNINYESFASSSTTPQRASRILRIVENKVNEGVLLRSQLSENMSSAEDITRLRKLKDLEPIQSAWDEWKFNKQLLKETETLLSEEDPAMRALASEEHTRLSETLSSIVDVTFPNLLKPPSTTAHLSALIELKSGVGGAESSLFLADMLRMYQRFAASAPEGWQASVLSMNENEGGGLKEATLEVKCPGSYDALRWESGVHRVQRVPATEASGRTHTSTVAVIVLPLIEEKDAAKESLYNMSDVKVEVMRARGAGGQHVNKTESAVRLTHIPTGITVSMQDERSQHQNKRRAFQVLNARLLDQKIQREMAERRATRNNLVRSADRSEKIRTYNYAQERVTDHRIQLTMKNLAAVMDGEALHLFIDALRQDHEESIMEDVLSETESA